VRIYFSKNLEKTPLVFTNEGPTWSIDISSGEVPESPIDEKEEEEEGKEEINKQERKIGEDENEDEYVDSATMMVEEQREKERGKEGTKPKGGRKARKNFYAYVSVGANSHSVTLWNLLSTEKFESKIASHSHNIPCVCNTLFSQLHDYNMIMTIIIIVILYSTH
jgi:hypothetical protein